MKKKIFGITLAIALIVLMIAGTSMAYFTDVEDATNVFTSGNVDINLMYDGQLANEDSGDVLSEAITNKGVYPGQKLGDKNVMIQNIGTEDAYVGAIITITNANNSLHNVLQPVGESDFIPASIRDFLTDLVDSDVDDDYIIKYVNINEDGTVSNAHSYGYKFFVVSKTALSGTNNQGQGIDTITLFNTIQIPTAWDNKEMAYFNGTTINVKAYATQTMGFDGANGVATADTALTTAFGDWAGYASATPLS